MAASECSSKNKEEEDLTAAADDDDVESEVVRHLSVSEHARDGVALSYVASVPVIHEEDDRSRGTSTLSPNTAGSTTSMDTVERYLSRERASSLVVLRPSTSSLSPTGDDDAAAAAELGRELREYVSMQGFVRKKSSSKLVGWQERWLYLWERSLYYFDQRASSPRALFDVRLCEVALKRPDSDASCCKFVLTYGHWAIKFQAPTRAVACEWVAAIENNRLVGMRLTLPTELERLHKRLADRTQRKQKVHEVRTNANYFPPSPARRARHQERVDSRSSSESTSRSRTSAFVPMSPVVSSRTMHRSSGSGGSVSADAASAVEERGELKLGSLDGVVEAEDVPALCNTGDIVLFHTNSVRSGIVRGLTGSEYDHVGMFVKFANQQCGVLETLGNTGVQISNWSGFVNHWHTQYEFVAIRRLRYEVDHEMGERLQRLIRATVGKKYKWTPVRRSESVAFDHPDRTFFCSELVAEALKEMGLLRPSLASARYMPGCFSSKSNLVLMRGAQLGEELLVRFEFEK